MVEVLEVVLSIAEERVRGRLQRGGWISLQNTNSGTYWVRPLDYTPSLYWITNSTFSTETVARDSPAVDRINSNTVVY